MSKKRLFASKNAIEPSRDLKQRHFTQVNHRNDMVDPANTFTVTLIFIFRLLQYKVVVNRHIH